MASDLGDIEIRLRGTLGHKTEGKTGKVYSGQHSLMRTSFTKLYLQCIAVELKGWKKETETAWILLWKCWHGDDDAVLLPTHCARRDKWVRPTKDNGWKYLLIIFWEKKLGLKTCKNMGKCEIMNTKVKLEPANIKSKWLNFATK